MGLNTLTLNSDLAKIWQSILIQSELKIRQNEIAVKQTETKTPKRVSEFLWQVDDGNTELKILEASFLNKDDTNVYLVFMPTKNKAEYQLLMLVTEILLEAGACKGKK